ncbi:SPP1 Gp6-like portal protein [Isoptericola jiangsuensis]|uniref:SPP1 Gp6-like portal protein n=1 Tax=Isoptericola jiangsuensis TaxID=548579 RepID=A0A2A9EYD0_9MICO|nr:phage portal protein [Isoptericola jiangsuensis]PFG44157.1 SPP1 Gp6-like portal protein [Isoptericola jiangsuensis]
MTTTTTQARDLIDRLDAERAPGGRLDIAERYAYSGDTDLPYMPRQARREYRELAKSSREHRVPAVLGALTAPLRVVGFRSTGATDNLSPWDNWQANGLDARADGVHMDALAAGVSYVRVTPSNQPGRAAITPCRFDSVLADYANLNGKDTDWPTIALHYIGTTVDTFGTSRRVFDVWDAESRTRFTETDRTDNVGGLVASEPVEHGLGVVPMVRFRERWSPSGSPGLASVLKNPADRLNRALLAWEVAIQYASFRQRWATGLVIPEDDETGEPVEPFESAVDRLWVSDSPDAKFGDFAQTDTSGMRAAVEDARTALAVLAGVQPGLVEGLDVAGAKTGAAATSSSLMDRRLRALSASFGESWEQVLRLAAQITGDTEAAADTSARVVFEVIEAESVQATVTALATAVGSLGLPPEATWPSLVAVIPGASANDVETWKALARDRDGRAGLAVDYVVGAEEPAVEAEPAVAA